MKIFLRNNIWYARFSIQGQQYIKSTGQDDKHLAYEQAILIAADIINERKNRKTPKLSTLKLWDIDRAAATGADMRFAARRITSMWRQIINTAGDISAAEWKEETTMQYIIRRKQQSVTGQTIRREIGAVKRMLITAKRRGYIDTAPEYWPRIKSDTRDEKKSGQFIPFDELKSFLELLPDDIADEYLFVLHTGLRKYEIKRIKFSNISGSILEMTAEMTKNRQLRRIPLSHSALMIVKKRQLRSSDDFVFSRADFQKTVSRVAKRHGFSRTITLRDMRHMFHTLGLQSSNDQTATVRLAGNSLDVIERYQHTTHERDRQVIDGIETAVKQHIGG